jgi:hypothetical protein
MAKSKYLCPHCEFTMRKFPESETCFFSFSKIYFCPFCMYATDNPSVFAISIQPRKHYQLDEFLLNKHGGNFYSLDSSSLYDVSEDVDFACLERLLDSANCLDASFCKLTDGYFKTAKSARQHRVSRSFDAKQNSDVIMYYRVLRLSDSQGTVHTVKQAVKQRVKQVVKQPVKQRRLSLLSNEQCQNYY